MGYHHLQRPRPLTQGTIRSKIAQITFTHVHAVLFPIRVRRTDAIAPDPGRRIRTVIERQGCHAATETATGTIIRTTRYMMMMGNWID